MEGTGPGHHGKCYSIHILKRKEEADQQPFLISGIHPSLS